jgi:hypothetical protein
VPRRNYGSPAKLLVEAVASDDSGTVGSTVAAVARQAGRDSVSGTGVVDALCRCGYEPPREPMATSNCVTAYSISSRANIPSWCAASTCN